ncbi:hypothetical protein CEE45_00360 [Candidatus Heimdallarchaeota archaeon B3_Heim]|nr:MAG: hypothetical protein CEE45_00360 [Candidatus Heimdallarchaeota archaeon B3_Heim]
MSWYNLACCTALQKKIEESIDCLTKAIELNHKVKDEAKDDPDLNNIKKDSRYKKLMRIGDESFFI